MKKTFIFCFLLIIISCEKDRMHDSDELFARILIDKIAKQYNVKDSIYFDFNYLSIVLGGDYQYGGGFANGDYRIDNIPGTIYDQFSIRFQNIPFDSINKGFYDIVGKKDDGRYIDKGVKIIWMDPNTWSYLFNLHIKSEDFVSCEDLNPNYNCLNDIVDYNLFMTSSHVNNETQLEITRTFHKDYEVYWFSDSSYHISSELIVEGRIKNCQISSRIDDAFIKNLSGNFRIHIPAPRSLSWQ